MYVTLTENSNFADSVQVTQNKSLYSQLEAGIDDIKNGNTLTEEEMDLAIELM